MSAFRLPEGGAVDRGRTLAFTFDGKPYLGSGATASPPRFSPMASASSAAASNITGRAELWGAWTEEPNAIVDVTRFGRTTPNLRATTEALENDLVVRSVNALPTAQEDRAALLDVFSAFMPSGFYYKTFLWPRWETFEPAIRAFAGLGRLDPTIARRPTIRSSMRAATCSWSARDQPVSPRRTPPREQGAWSFSWTIGPSSAVS